MLYLFYQEPPSRPPTPTVESFKRSLSTNSRETPSYFYVGDRLGQIHHARLRTNCSSLNYYLYHKNIIEDPRCTCGLPETNKHFLLECRKYNAIRMDMLHEVSQFCQPTLHTLLFGNMALADEANESIFKYVLFLNLVMNMLYGVEIGTWSLIVISTQ